MNRFKELLKQRTLIFDGAMGTSIASSGLTARDYGDAPDCPEILCVTRPDIVQKIHRSFLSVGCDIIETNSFGGAEHTLTVHGLADRTDELNRAAGECARAAADEQDREVFVSGSVGPGSKMPSLGHISVNELVSSFERQARGLIAGGVDLFQIETSQDMLQAKAAYYGIRQAQEKAGTSLPVIVQITLEKNGRTVVGTDISAVIASFSRFNISALGMNCGTGPKSMIPALKELSAKSPFPISVLPNAGLPKQAGGELVYDQSPDTYADIVSSYVSDLGVELVGGCCGTTPDHLREVVERVRQKDRKARMRVDFVPFFSSLYSAVPMQADPSPLIIGERANATGSKKFRSAVEQEDVDRMMEIILSQEAEQAHLIDLSVAAPGRDEQADMTRIIGRVNSEAKAPLCVDSTRPEVIRTALRNYAGRALINSINLENAGAQAETVLSLAKEYGAAVIGLTIDDAGMAKTAERKAAVAEDLVNFVTARGLDRRDLYIDPLTFTLGSGDSSLYDAGIETLGAVSRIKELFPDVHLLLGVSNVSYGLKPAARRRLNVLFLAHAVRHGLDAAIFHPGKLVPVSRIPEEERTMFEALIADRRTAEYTPLEAVLTHYSKQTTSAGKTPPAADPEKELYNRIVQGRKRNIEETARKALTRVPALQLIQNHMLPAMEQVGTLFGSGELQLPFVLKSAETMKSAVAIVEPEISDEEQEKKARFLLATVKGDVHDIGKNLVGMMLSSNGFDVIDIGIDIDSADLAARVKKHSPDFIGLSALLVRSTREIASVLEQFNSAGITTPVFCGGAAVTESFVGEELCPLYNGAVLYAGDAFSAIDQMRNMPNPARCNRQKEQKTADPLEKKHPPDTTGNTNTAKEDTVIKRKPAHTIQTVQYTATDVLAEVNRRTLYRVRWQMRDEEAADTVFSRIAPDTAAAVKPRGVYGFFTRDETDFIFPRQTEPPGRSLNDYLTGNGVLGLFAVSVGAEQVDSALAALRESGELADYFLYSQLVSEMADALAQMLHGLIQSDFGIPINRGKRYSPGFPVWPDIEEQRKIFSLLSPETVGITLTDGCEMLPIQSVSALVIPHPDAKYFSVR